MKKKANKQAGRGTSWSEVSDIDFGAYQLKQNRFAKRVRKEGILLVHDAPSAASLKAIPQADFGRVKACSYPDQSTSCGQALRRRLVSPSPRCCWRDDGVARR